MGTASYSVVQALFERRGLKTIFEHVRDTLVATILVAAGLEGLKQTDATGPLGLLNPAVTGYFVAGVGCALIALNFVDGLRKLAKFRQNFLLQAALSLAYLFASIRIVQLIIMLRTHSC